MSGIGVVHLVRSLNGLETFRNFLESYRLHDSGCDHKLIFVFKGFDNSLIPESYKELLIGLPHETLHVSDYGYDIVSYRLAASAISCPTLVFLNSFTRLQYTGWLEALRSAHTGSDVGIAGASGSWESQYAFYRHPSEPWTFKAICRYIRHRVKINWIPEFPNYHIRTTGFMVNREIFLNVRVQTIKYKKDAYDFESGYNGLTRQLQSLGKRPVVVGRDGIHYEMRDWAKSETFRQGNQENLMISDKQTRAYDAAPLAERCKLSLNTWREHSFFWHKELRRAH